MLSYQLFNIQPKDSTIAAQEVIPLISECPPPPIIQLSF